MGFFDFWFWPFMAFGMLLGILIGVLVFAFWVWMIVDAVKRKFRKENEKIVWVLIIVFGSWIGALVYYFAVRIYNPKGISK